MPWGRIVEHLQAMAFRIGIEWPKLAMPWPRWPCGGQVGHGFESRMDYITADVVRKNTKSHHHLHMKAGQAVSSECVQVLNALPVQVAS